MEAGSRMQECVSHHTGRSRVSQPADRWLPLRKFADATLQFPVRCLKFPVPQHREFMRNALNLRGFVTCRLHEWPCARENPC